MGVMWGEWMREWVCGMNGYSACFSFNYALC